MSDVTVLQITDLHQLSVPAATLLEVDTQETLQTVLRQALAEARPDLLLVTGDVAHDPEAEVYERTVHCLESHYDGPWLWTPGNHDLSAPMAQALAKVGRDAERLREHSLHDWRVLMLDTHVDDRVGGCVAEDELAWLTQRLSSSDARHVLVAGHHPPVAIDSPWLDEQRIVNRDELLALLTRHRNVRGYTCGHVHQSMDTTHDGLRIMTTPSTCFQFVPGSDDFAIDDAPPAWRWLSLTPSGLIDTRVGWARR